MSLQNERLIVADDHPVFREGMRRILKRIYPNSIVHEAGTYGELLDAARGTPTPSMFILDLIFPDFDMEVSIAALREEFPSATVVVVSMVNERHVIERVMACGAEGFISKALPPSEIAEALNAVRDGEFVVRAEGDTSGAVLPVMEWSDDIPPLTPRQTDVLRLVGEGHSNKQIGRMLDISPFTVRVHVSALLRVLQVDSRAAAAAKAASAGIV